jgi:hypothetical protein
MHWLLTRSRVTWLALLTLALLFGLLGIVVLLTYLAAVAAFWSAYVIYTFIKESILKLFRLEPRNSVTSEPAKEICCSLYDLQLAEYWRFAHEARRARIEARPDLVRLAKALSRVIRLAFHERAYCRSGLCPQEPRGRPLGVVDCWGAVLALLGSAAS